MISPHERARVLVDTQSGKAQAGHGMDSKECASFKRAYFYAEDAEHSGLIWLDLVPSDHNPSGILTKQCRKISEHGFSSIKMAFCAAQ